ncbi:DUF6645 domain-containing protein [Escherichia coli]|uniref:DUF6645 domain-containing protein n=1 Tax=Escherichia coli TaxID=562 RepID=UPI0020984821|nr:DUF6645 domain-containing protein [Escherichia coli]
MTLADSTQAKTFPNLLAVYLSTDAVELNLLHHRQQGAKISSFGAFNNEWHTLEFEFAGSNSTQVTPIFDTVRGTPLELVNSPTATKDNTL